MKDSLDTQIKHALSKKYTPKKQLNTAILERKEEKHRMKKKNIGTIAATVVLALAVCGGTGYAAVKYLSPDKVATQFANKTLAEAFQGKDAIWINETKEENGYSVTLMGVVSGKNLNAHPIVQNEKVVTDSTYMVIAVEKSDVVIDEDKSDGAVMPKPEDENFARFLISPLIKGENPYSVNIFSMANGCGCTTQDGIQYYLLECNNLEVFAKQGVQLAVTDAFAISDETYSFDGDTKVVSTNQEYAGVNLLFDVPFPEEKADSSKAKELLKQWNGDMESEEVTEDTDEVEDVEKSTEEELYEKARLFLRYNDAEYVMEHFTLLKDQVQTLEPDSDGKYAFRWEAFGTGMEMDPPAGLDELFWPEQRDVHGSIRVRGINITEEYFITELYILNEDESVTMKPYYISLDEFAKISEDDLTRSIEK